MKILQVNTHVLNQSLIDDAQISGTCSLPACLKNHTYYTKNHNKNIEAYMNKQEVGIVEKVCNCSTDNINRCQIKGQYILHVRTLFG